jgi:hypothetical protein
MKALKFPHSLSERANATLIIALLPLLFLYPAVIGKVTLVQGDGWSALLGLRILMGQSLSQGLLPLWNPYIFGGMPLLADIYVGTLYPPNWLFALFPPGVAANLVVITTYYLVLVGTYRFARSLGMNRTGAMTTGVVFTFGGFIVSAMGQASTIASAAWLPWILLATEKLYQRVSWRWITLGSIFIALQFFAGVPQIMWYTVLVGGAYFLFSALIREHRQPRLRFVLGLSVMAICGALLSAIQLLPLRELQLLGDRTQLNYYDFASYSFPLRQVPSLVFPYFFGGAARPPYNIPYWGGEWGLFVTCGYVGMLALLLGVVAVIGLRRQSILWFWVGLAIISLVLSFGYYLPFGLNHWLYQIPVYNLFRASHRHMFEFTFACAVLAGLGVNYLSQSDRKQTNRAFVMGTVVMTIVVSITLAAYIFNDLYFVPGAPRSAQSDSPTNPEALVPLFFFSLSIVVLWNYMRHRTLRSGALLVLVLLTDLASYGHFLDWTRDTFNVSERLTDPPTVKYIKSRESDLNSFRILSRSTAPLGGNYDLLNHPNISIARGLQSANGYDMLQMRRPGAVMGEMVQNGAIQQISTFNATDQGLNLLNIKYLLMERAAPLRAGEGLVYEGISFRGLPFELSLRDGNRFEFMAGEMSVTDLAIVSTMSNSTSIIDGTPVVKLTFHLNDGRLIERELQAGRDTSEWAYDRADIRAAIKHKRARIVESWFVNDKAESYQGHSYLTKLPFDRAQIVKLEMEHLGSDAQLLIRRISLFDSLTGLSVPVVAIDVPQERWRKLASFGEADLYENLKAMPRAWFVNRVVVAPSADVLQTIRQGKERDGRLFDPAETALIDKEDFDGEETFPSFAKTDSDVTITKYEPQRIEMRTLNPQAGFLVLSEVYYPGWDAWVDGVKTPVYRVNHTLRGIIVPPGEHIISFVYVAPSILRGAIYFGIGVAVLLIGFWYPRLQRIKGISPQSEAPVHLD